MRKHLIHRMTRAARRRFYTRLAILRQRADYLDQMAEIDRKGFGYYL